MEEITVTFTKTGQKVLSLVIYGKPVAYMRTRSTKVNGRTIHYTPKVYKDYRKLVADAIVKAVGRENLPVFPPPNHKDRKKYIHENRYCLAATFYRVARRMDKDNLEKALSDSFKDAKLIADDEQIDSSCIEREIDKDNPRVEFCLIKLPVPVKPEKKSRKKNKQE